jgi:hypothetical protein
MWKSAFLTLCVGTALAAAPVFADDAKPAPDAAKAPSEATCAKDAGSRIPRKDSDCGPSPSRRYTKADLDRTGAQTAGGALSNLSPALTISH